MEFSIIAAVDAENGLGKGGTIPWRLSADMKHLKEVTTREYAAGKQNVLLMGRRTWESLPVALRPLPGRISMVLTTTALELPNGVLQASSFAEAIKILEKKDIGRVFVFGGGSVYAQAITDPSCKEIFLTKLQQSFGCDTFFPLIPEVFKQVEASEPQTEGDISFSYYRYKRT